MTMEQLGLEAGLGHGEGYRPASGSRRLPFARYRTPADPPGMALPDGSAKVFEKLICSLERRDVLSPEEKAAIEALPYRTVIFEGGVEIVKEESRPCECCLIVEGFAARSQYLSDGRRQISAMLVPGDFADLHCLLQKTIDHSVVSIRSCKVLFVPHAALYAMMEEFPHLQRLLWLSTIVDSAIHRAWIAGIGRRTPAQHIAHHLCELHDRLDTVGLVRDRSFEYPPTQAEMSDMVGLSLVHVNRTIQELRAKGLVKWNGGVVSIPDFDRLQAFADYVPTYLSLHREPR